MHSIYFYKDKNGKELVLDYLKELSKRKDKDSWIKANKINDYIEILKQYGTQAGEPYLKHLDGEIWELRPLRDRILFVAWHNGSYVLLHTLYEKNLENSKKRNRESKAGAYGFDRKGELIMNENSAIGSSWDEVRADLFTSEEIAESNLRVALIGELIKARQEKGISQKKLEELSGVKQPIIARMEKGTTNPQIDTILKVLVPLGKTLAVVPLEK